MGRFARGVVRAVTEERLDLLRAVVATEEGEVEALGYPFMLGPVRESDEVVLNTTGVALGLGTGGVAFLLWNLSGPGPGPDGRGHIVKMRYTPWQSEVLAAEEPGGPHHAALERLDSIDGLPVVACGLHSQIAGAVAGIKAAHPEARVGYLMSDGGALPLPFSELVRRLRGAELIDVTCTHGHAFGGDIEAVNVFSGLAALRAGERVDAVVAALGPGLSGTGTALGFSGLEQGQVLDAVGALGGAAIACLRISYADGRGRHRGVSHHSLTALRIAASRRCTVALPALGPHRAAQVRAALERAGIAARHALVEASGADALALLAARGVSPSSMGRSLEEEPELHRAAGAAGEIAGRLIGSAGARSSS
jgi:hypothetical protein